MLELKRFKENYFKGRLLWVTGTAGLQKVGITCELLRLCEVEEKNILVLSAKQFLGGFKEDQQLDWLIHYRAVIVRNLEGGEWRDLIECLRRYRELHFKYDLRVILVCSDEISLEKKADLYRLNPVVIRISGEGNHSRGLNERVHGLLEKASWVARKPIFQLSERAAAFLEITEEDWSDAELLDWLVLGVLRSQGQILRFSDLLPQKFLKGTQKAIDISICN